MAFVAFEGLDGTGKSTLMNGLANELRTRGVDFILTREPGGTKVGEEVRSLLLNPSGEIPSERCELLLYEAIRAQNVDRKIRPALSRRQWVLCDRYSASTIAFQGGGRGLDESAIQWLNKYATGDCQPDLWVFLDLTVQQTLQRKQGPQDRFDRESVDFHKMVRQKYLEISKDQPHWLCLDARLSTEKLQTQLVGRLQKMGFLK